MREKYDSIIVGGRRTILFEDTTNRTGIRVVIDGEGQFATHAFSDEDAVALRDALVRKYGAPKPVTFQSQFAELEIGEQFIIHPDGDASRPSNAVKIDKDSFFNYTRKWVKVASTINSRSRIVKN